MFLESVEKSYSRQYKEEIMEKVIISAVAENNVIGKNGGLPWHYPEDMEHFKETTMGFPVVMGRTTYLSLPESVRPLEGRKNIVLTRSEMDVPGEVELANSLEEAWEIAEDTGKDKVFIMGGASVYEQTIDLADKMVLTEVHEEYEGDTFFPDWSEEEWKEVSRDDRGELSFVEYERG